MFSFLRRLTGPRFPRREFAAGPTLAVVSGTLVAFDPGGGPGPIAIGPFPVAEVPTGLEFLLTADGRRRVARLVGWTTLDPPDERREIGRVAAETGAVVLTDAATRERYRADAESEAAMLDRIRRRLERDILAELKLDDAAGANLIAMASGFGRGEYPAVALLRAGELVGFELIFIGPERDRISEASPDLDPRRSRV